MNVSGRMTRSTDECEMSRSEIERAFDLDVQLRHVDQIFERVFQEVAA